MLICSNYQIIRISLICSMWLICLEIMQIMRHCTSLNQRQVLLQVRGTSVGWLCITSWILFEGDNLGCRCPFLVYHILFQSLQRKEPYLEPTCTVFSCGRARSSASFLVIFLILRYFHIFLVSFMIFIFFF